MKLHKWSDIRRQRFSEAELAELDRRVQGQLEEMNLSELRRELGVSQEQLAKTLEVDQTQVSRLEHRSDYLLSTLRRCVRALGGEITITAVFGDKRIRLHV